MGSLQIKIRAYNFIQVQETIFMQVLGAYHKRKSIEKVDPQMPKRKISDHSRTQSKRKHRTEYKSIDSPQIELKAYKRKNLSILNELQSKHVADKLSTNAQSIIHTEQSKLLTEQSIIKDPELRKAQNNSVNSAKQSKGSKIPLTTSTNTESRQITSRFTISYEQHDEVSLTSLINQNKTTDSNPLINTARLRDQQGIHVNPFQFREAKPQQGGLPEKTSMMDKNEAGQVGQVHVSNTNSQGDSVKNNNNDQILNNQTQRIDQDAVQDQDQVQNNEGQNFDDYQFGGQNSISNDFDDGQSAQKSISRKKPKKPKSIMPPPTVQSYTFDPLICQKPQNWRQINRYIPETQQQNRMAQQRLVKEKQSLQLKRQQQQIMKMIQQYQQNKNSINLVSQRKIQTSKIVQKIYRDQRLSKNSVSLPQLKPFSLPKRQILLSEVNYVNTEGYVMENPVSIEEKFKVNNTIARNFRQQKKPKLQENLKGSLSYSKLGFGSSEPRLLNEQDIKESELQSIQKIQKKLRQKGISFDANSVRKGLLNFRDVPIYKISGKTNNTEQNLNDESKLELPKKQLMSNGFYKIFPL